MGAVITQQEALAILKAVTAWNSGKVEFHKGYLEYADQAELYVTRDKDIITLKVKMPSVKEQ